MIVCRGVCEVEDITLIWGVGVWGCGGWGAGERGGRGVPEITLSISNQCKIGFALNSSWVNKMKMHLIAREKE